MIASQWLLTLGASVEGKESDDDELFKGYIEDDKMETEDEKGDEEEEPGNNEESSGSDDDSDRKPAGKPTGQAEDEDDTNSEMSWWAKHVEVIPRMPLEDKVGEGVHWGTEDPP